MKANVDCEGAQFVTVYLNGRKLDYCMEADEEAGEVLVCYRDVENKAVPWYSAEPGSLICEGVQVLRLRGEVEIKIAVTGGIGSPGPASIRRRTEETFKPLDVVPVEDYMP